MSFFDMDLRSFSHKTILNFRTIFLQVHSINTFNAYITLKIKSIRQKRMSSCLRRLPAAISIEAALVIPLFMFFMVNLMMLILVFKDYSQTLSKLQQKARVAALTSINAESGSQIVDLKEELEIAPLIREIGFTPTKTDIEVFYRKWTGYDVSGAHNELEEDEYVYITEYGSVYHRNRSCRHLVMQVKIVSPSDISGIRNNNMEKYSACEICNGAGSGVLFVTAGGNKYHGSASCSGIKRTVKAVKLSEVSGTPACSLCGE